MMLDDGIEGKFIIRTEANEVTLDGASYQNVRIYMTGTGEINGAVNRSIQ